MLVALFVLIPLHGALAAATCGIATSKIGGVVAASLRQDVQAGVANAAAVFTLETIFQNGFDCKTGGPYGGGEPTGSGGSVSATIVDQNNAAVSGQPTLICGLDLCTSAHVTDAGGSVSFSTGLSMKRPAFLFGDAINYPLFGIALPPNSSTSFGTLQTGGLPPLGTGGALTPGTNAISGDVTVSIPPGAQVAINTLTYETSDEQKLRTVRIPVNAASTPLLPCASCGFALLYGLAPAGTILCPAAKLTIALPHQTQSPNDFGWAPGAIVEFWITTTDTEQIYAPYAGWRLISYGHVSADGASIATENWGGFNFLDNLAVRLMP